MGIGLADRRGGHRNVDQATGLLAGVSDRLLQQVLHGARKRACGLVRTDHEGAAVVWLLAQVSHLRIDRFASDPRRD